MCIKDDHETSVTNQHLMKVEKDWIYCNMCGNAFSNKQEFQLHYDQHLQIYKCDTCFSVFSDQTSLNAHVKEMHETKIKEYDNVITYTGICKISETVDFLCRYLTNFQLT